MSANLDEKLLDVPEIVLEKLPFSTSCSNVIEGINMEHLQLLQKNPRIILQKLNDIQVDCHRNNKDKPKTMKKLIVRECLVKLNRDNLEELKLLLNTKCKFCNKSYKDRKSLENHLDKKHIIVVRTPQKKKSNEKQVRFSDTVIFHEHVKYHKCRKCVELFVTYEELKEHMKSKHKKRKCYICNYCKTSFVDRMFFKLHIKLHCDSCGELCINKSKLLEHKCDILNLPKCKEYKIKFRAKNKKSCFTFPTESKKLREINFFECDQCTGKFEIETDLIKHKWTHFLKLDQIGENSQNIPQLQELLNNSNNISRTDCKLNMNPVVLLEKNIKNAEITDNFIDVNNLLECNGMSIKKSNVTTKINKDNETEVSQQINEVTDKEIKKKKLKKTLFSEHQCNICFKYYSTSYCLSRHKETQHKMCTVCRTDFPCLRSLEEHNCTGPPMFGQTGMVHPVLLFDNYGGIISCQKSLQEYPQNIDENNFQNNESEFDDFEMPAPIVELTEYDLPITYIGEQLCFPVNNSSNINPVLLNNNSEIRM